MILAVAIQRACAPAAKRDLPDFLDASVARVSCLPGKAFSGQTFHRLATKVGEAELEQAQVALARPAVARFDLSTDVLAFDTTNFDTLIATTTAKKSARSMMASLAEIDATLVRTDTGGLGRRPTAMLPPDVSAEQVKATAIFELGRWMPSLLSARPARGVGRGKSRVA